MRNSFLLFFVIPFAASGQWISIGMKAGVPLTEAMSTRNTGIGNNGSLSYVNTGRWTVGPTVELHLPFRLSVEFDALFRGYQSGNAFPIQFGTDLPAVSYAFQQDVKAWDFPLLLKYRFPVQRIVPFIAAGASWTHESRDISYSYSCVGPESCLPSELPSLPSSGQRVDSAIRNGAVGAAGIEFQLGKVRISPEVRYTRLADPRTNQVSILVGFTF